MSLRIPFNKPAIVGKELHYIAQAVTLGQIAADGHFTKLCCKFFESEFGIPKALLTPSATAALEMAAMLFKLRPGDEVIMPSYTFVSTANAVVREGARPVFVDIRPDTLNIDESLIESAVTPRTRAIFPIHYAGVAAEMDPIMALARRRGLKVCEDAAQGVCAYYKGRPLGSIADLAAYSFHETKNFTCGEGGALCVNDPALIRDAEIIRDKGTNRQQFFRGEIDKYTWVAIGSSYVPSEICSAFLYAQMEMRQAICRRRREVYETYLEHLRPLEQQGLLRLPIVPEHCQTNHHLFHILLPDAVTRDGLMAHLKSQGILAVFHYMPLHLAPIGRTYGYREGQLPITENLSARLLRLPLFFGLSHDDQMLVIDQIIRHLRQPVAPVGR
jgi:dTDP-4-amino-4,6-dideoxygalactose transaminase